jgi:tRNA/rRNA methyltransferase
MSGSVIRVVLVRPESPANVGAVARVVRNTGLDGLDLVVPGDYRTVEAWRTAWGAQDALEQARSFADLAAAVENATRVVAFTGRHERGVPVQDVRELAAELAALGPEERAALVFGPETSGLTLDELALCGRRVRIPTDPAQPSLNLSHAVMVAGYEVFRAGARTPPGPRLAAHGEKERMLSLLRAGLRSIEALPAVNTDGYFREWQALFQRVDLTRRELRLLEHMARKMLRRPEKPVAEDDRARAHPAPED